jgi:O-antigen/teichoic acid export membrane protein
LKETEIQEREVAASERAPEGRLLSWLRNIFPSGFLGISFDTMVERLIPWISKGGYAIVDQGLISGSNFIVSIMLARWLAPEHYGAYAVAFGFFVFLSLAYGALVLEPMAVFGGTSYRNCLRGYLGSLLRMHFTMSLGMVAVFGLTAFVAQRVAPAGGLGGALAGVTIASPCVLLFWLARRSFYLELSPAKAAQGALVYFAVSFIFLVLLYRYRLLSPFSAFVLIGVAALATGCYLLIRLRRELRRTPFEHSSAEIWGRHWRYGRWALLSCAASWIPANIYYLLLGWFASMAQSGQLKALMNLTLPVEQIKMALGLLLLPYAGNVLERKGFADAGALSRRMTSVAIAIAVAYWTVILSFERPVFHILYSGRYMECVHLLPIVAIGSIAWCGSFGTAITLRAMESPSSVFVAFAIATAASVAVGIPATWAFGLTGSIWATNVSDLVSWVLLIWLLRRKMAGRSGGLERWAAWRNSGRKILSEEFSAD